MGFEIPLLAKHIGNLEWGSVPTAIYPRKGFCERAAKVFTGRRKDARVLCFAFLIPKILPIVLLASWSNRYSARRQYQLPDRR
jgi:hypothetical protein